MKDRKPGAPGRCSAVITAAERQKMLNGERFLITLKRDDLPEEEGTPYSKAAVLPDTLAAAICPEVADPTPADALKGLLPRNGSTAMNADLPMGGNKITGLGAPAADTDAVTKKYADTKAPLINIGIYTGDILSLDMQPNSVAWITPSTVNNPSSNYGFCETCAASVSNSILIKRVTTIAGIVWVNAYYEGRWEGWKRSDGIDKLSLSGGTMSGAINMDNKKITNLATPTADADASTKKYVDDGLNGRAPSGYGLGTGGKYESAVDNIFNGGFYRWDTDNDQTPFANGTMLVVPRAKDTSATQIAFCNASTDRGLMAFRTTTKDTVGAWEWINPPMATGKEYLTPEKWNRKPVYKMLVSMGKLTTEFVEVAHGASLYYVVGVEAMAINETNKMSFPIAYAANDNVDDIGVYVNDTTVTIHNPQLLSAYKGYVIIKYVK